MFIPLDRLEFFPMIDTTYKKLLRRVVVKPGVCGGEPGIQGTRISVTVILDSSVEGLSPKEITKHFTPLTDHHVLATIMYERGARL